MVCFCNSSGAMYTIRLPSFGIGILADGAFDDPAAFNGDIVDFAWLAASARVATSARSWRHCFSTSRNAALYAVSKPASPSPAAEDFAVMVATGSPFLGKKSANTVAK